MLSIIGLGFVGLSTAAVLAHKGQKVTGVDIDEKRLTAIKSGVMPFYEPKLEEFLKTSLDNGNLQITQNIEEAIQRTEITFLTVGTPSYSDGRINLSYLENAITSVGNALKNKSDFHLVVVKSTVVPLTTTSMVLPLLEQKSGKKSGIDFGVVVNPEFLKEGSAIDDTLNPHLIVIGSSDSKSGNILENFYKRFYGNEMPELIRTNTNTAELIKYANNAFLSTKISFINMIANMCQQISNVDVEDIAKAIGKDPRIGSQFLKAGPGFGGSCFPKDLNALIKFSESVKYEPTLLKATRDTNENQTSVILNLAEKTMGTVISGKKIAILGLSFKKDTDDVRESVSLKIIKKLIDQSCMVNVHDPMALNNTKKIFSDNISYFDDPFVCMNDCDCCILMVDWDKYKLLEPEQFIKKMKKPVLIDARRVLDPNKFINSSVTFAATGLGFYNNKT